MAKDMDALRNRLRDFRTRAAAIDEAVSMGEEAVDLAIELLGDRNEGVRWSAIRILAEAGDRRAVAPLIALLQRGESASDAAEALRWLTGQDFGEDAPAWRRWASLGAGVEGGADDPAALVAAALAGQPAELVGAREGRFVVQVSLPQGRRQRVHVDFRGRDAEGAPIVRLYTRCGRADPERFEWALRQNLSMPFGAIAIATIDGEENFVVFNALLRETATPVDLAKSLRAVAEKGDAVERLLAAEDAH